MAYVDKCCGVCGNYQELVEVGKVYNTLWKEFDPIYKRFAIGNVCDNCLEKGLGSIHVTQLKLSVYKSPEQVAYARKGVHYFDNLGKLAHRTNWVISYEDDVLEKLHHKACYGQPRVRWYNVYTPDETEVVGGITAKCKFKLRRILRKLSVKGDVRTLIK